MTQIINNANSISKISEMKSRFQKIVGLRGSNGVDIAIVRDNNHHDLEAPVISVRKRMLIPVNEVDKHISNEIRIYKHLQRQDSKNEFIVKMIENGEENLVMTSENGDTNTYKWVWFTMQQKKEDLFNWVQRVGPLTPKKALKIFAKVVSIVKFLHDNGVAHLDLKLENFFIDDTTESIRIGDFGVSEIITDRDKMKTLDENTFVGTPGYSDPLIYHKHSFNPFKADIYSLGIILFILSSHGHPYGRPKQEDSRYHYILVNGIEKFVKQHKQIDDKCAYIITRTVCELDKRLSINEIAEYIQ